MKNIIKASKVQLANLYKFSSLKGGLSLSHHQDQYTGDLQYLSYMSEKEYKKEIGSLVEVLVEEYSQEGEPHINYYHCFFISEVNFELAMLLTVSSSC